MILDQDGTGGGLDEQHDARLMLLAGIATEGMLRLGAPTDKQTAIMDFLFNLFGALDVAAMAHSAANTMAAASRMAEAHEGDVESLRREIRREADKFAAMLDKARGVIESKMGCGEAGTDSGEDHTTSA